MSEREKFSHYMFMAAVISLCCWGVVRGICLVDYNTRVTSHLQIAAITLDPDEAAKELSLALDGLQRIGVNRKSGSTSILPHGAISEDVGSWYDALEHDLSWYKGGPDTEAESRLFLDFLRLDISGHGVNGEVVSPPGISVYPRNRVFAAWAWLSVAFMLVSFLGVKDESPLPVKQ